MLNYNDLKKGTLFAWNGDPYEVLEYNFSRMQQRKPVAQTKIRNIKTGAVSNQTFKPSDSFHELDIQRKEVVFVFCGRGQCIFHAAGNPGDRFSVPEEKLTSKQQFLQAKAAVTARYIGDELLDIQIPIKVDLKVTEAPPAVKGNTAQGGLKQVTLETGFTINVPMFITTGDTVRINTESGEYVERVSS